MCNIDSYERQYTIVQLINFWFSSEICEEQLLELFATDQTLFVVDELIQMNFHVVENSAVDSKLVEVFDHLNKFWLSYLLYDMVKVTINNL